MFSRTFFKSGMEDEVCCAIFNAHAGVKGRQHRGYVFGHFVDNVAAEEVLKSLSRLNRGFRGSAVATQPVGTAPVTT